MSLISAATSAALAADVLRIANLVSLDFASAPLRVWSGRGPLFSAGVEWLGSAGLVSISAVDLAAADFAAPFTLTLSGLPDEHFDTYTRLMLADAAEWRGRRVVCYFQCFSAGWAPVDQPVAFRAGFMDKPAFHITPGENGPSRSITMQCEAALATRKRPRFGNYTDADQQARWPGDRGFEFSPVAASKSIKAPVAPE